MRRRYASSRLSLSMVRCAVLSAPPCRSIVLVSVSIVACSTSVVMKHDFATQIDASPQDWPCQPMPQLIMLFSFNERCGCQLRARTFQSMPLSSIDSCAGVNETAPLLACGHMVLPFSNRLANRHRPWPSNHSSWMMSPCLPRKTNTWPENGSWVGEVCARPARASNPLRMSVWPAASDTRVPAGRPIISVRPESARYCTAPPDRIRPASTPLLQPFTSRWARVLQRV